MLSYYGDDMEEYRRLCGCEDNIKMDPKEVFVNVMNCMELTVSLESPCERVR